MDINLLKTLNILYVEDEDNLRHEVVQNIAPFVKEIIVAKDGLEGLSLFQKHQDTIDLIISDIMMPNMDGIVMVENIRKINQEIPVIYTTAFNDSSYLLKTIQLSVSAYILKPIDIELLLEGIEKASVVVENKMLREKLLRANDNLTKSVQDKTQELEKQNHQLQELLYKDTLTNLPNRYSLLEDLKSVTTPNLVLFNLDAFKNINDLYGEDVGNLVLVQVSDMLKKFVSYYNECKLYKIGPDEFALLKDSPFDETSCKQKIRLVLNAIEGKKIYLNDEDLWIHVTATLGISSDISSPLSTADIALRKAKNKKLSFYIYDKQENLHREYENDLKYSKIITKAIEEDLVVPFYQPIVNDEANIVKYEALMRIVVDGEELSPFHFLDISKKIKQYNTLERMMISKVIREVKEKKIYVNINVSIEDVTNSAFLDFIKKELNTLDDGKYITFEFLEDEDIFDYDDITAFAKLIKSYGAKLAIDDFGSGYSNFVHILNLDLDYIKIDASLIKNIDKDKNSLVVVRTINDYAHALGLKTVAEFVHSKEVFAVLKELGIDFFQGYYFGKPAR
jgi:diguanylate cyclase (GGDEF)-like protein